MDDRAGAGGVGMVEGPDLDTAVFVRCLGRWRGHSKKSIAQRSRGFEDEDEDMENAHGEDQYAPVEVSCGYTAHPTDQNEDGVGGENPRVPIEERRELMRRGDIWIVRWKSVREAVARGECELV